VTLVHPVFSPIFPSRSSIYQQAKARVFVNFLGTGEVEPDLATDHASRNVPISSLLA